MTTENRGLALYMQIGSYEGVIHKYANPYNINHWEKYSRLRRKILQWQNHIV
jgi:hypothetical protein